MPSILPIPAEARLGPSTTLANRAGRALWGVVQATLFAWSPRPAHAWRAMLLRAFGARLGPRCHIYPKARVWAPWQLVCGEAACIADEAVVYNPAGVTLGAFAVVSQRAYLCGAGHDIDDPAFPMVSRPITLGAHAWVAARASVQAGVHVAEGAVLGLGGVACTDLEAWTVYGGVPARRLRARRRAAPQSS